MQIEIKQNVVIAKITSTDDQAEYLRFMEEEVYSRKKPFVVINDLRGLDFGAVQRLISAKHFLKNALVIRKYLLGVAVITHDAKAQHAAERGIRWQVPLPFPTLIAFNFEEAFKWAQMLWWRRAGRVSKDDNPETEPERSQ